MNDNTILYRQVPGAWIAEDGVLSTQAFNPTWEENYALSLANGDIISAQDAQNEHIASGNQSAAVASLTVKNFTDLALQPKHDRVPTPHHVSVQYPKNNRERRRAIARTLITQYTWAIPPTQDPRNR